MFIIIYNNINNNSQLVKIFTTYKMKVLYDFSLEILPREKKKAN